MLLPGRGAGEAGAHVTDATVAAPVWYYRVK